ncbi:MAG TPA: GNAT family N-acetyltransferase [Lutibacter sp.]|nr:GNAT family N-acetyltransferase [Lutibacter sp.]
MFVKEISSKETFPLRIEILRNGISENYQFLEDDFESTIHLGAFIKKQCIGILTLIQKEFPNTSKKNSYQLRGMAINKSSQRQGVGKILITETFKILQHKEVELLWCNARQNAIDFYTKLGFRIIGKAFDIPSIGLHYTMSIDLGNL